ncbi:hypothetical protein BDZ89DRAFT_1040530 [Hymenopellis radicata]|nr:hypothetical protein BDZ89DRAFT_1040530 [Hymenopellis radicata]
MSSHPVHTSGPPPDYRFYQELRGPKDGVCHLAFSHDGHFLAAITGQGGKVFIWDVTSFLPIPVPDDDLHCTVCTWIYLTKVHLYTLVLGSDDGRIVTWNFNARAGKFYDSHKLPMGSVGGSEAAIISLGVYSDVVNPSRNRARVAFSHGNPTEPQVSVYALSPEDGFVKIFSVKLPAKTGGHLALLDGKTGALIKENKEAPLVMASVAVNESSDAFVSMNGQDFELYRRDSLCHTSLLCTLPCDPPLVRYPKQVAFVEGSKLVVGGTDRGKANVYDTASKQLVGTLDYPLGGLVQPVATCSTEELSYIAIAGSTLQQPSRVLIWVKRHSPITRPLTSTQGGIDPLQTGSIHVSSARSTFSDVEHVLRNIFLLVFYATAIFITVTIAWLFTVRTCNEIKVLQPFRSVGDEQKFILDPHQFPGQSVNSARPHGSSVGMTPLSHTPYSSASPPSTLPFNSQFASSPTTSQPPQATTVSDDLQD